MDEAAKEIERLRSELAFHRKTMANIQAVHAFQEMMPPLPLPTITDAEREAVAWATVSNEGATAGTLWTLSDSIEAAFRKKVDSYQPCDIVPLYRTPQTCPYVVGRTTLHCSLTPLTLTDEERFVLREVRDTYADEDDVACNEIAAVIDGLLERLK
jgi:hypothetical protein